jgi:hypothetical protein
VARNCDDDAGDAELYVEKEMCVALGSTMGMKPSFS